MILSLICICLIAWMGIKFFVLAAKAAWVLTKGIVIFAILPIAGLLFLLFGAVWISLIVLVIGTVVSIFR